MKASGSGYGISGAGEYDRTDYQEHRKDTAMTGGIVIAVLVVGAAIVWFFGTQLSNWWKNNNPITHNPLSDAEKAAADSLTNSQKYMQDRLDKIGKGILDNTGRAEQQLADTVNRVKKAAEDIPKDVITLGNVITSNEAQNAGKRAADTVNSLGLAPAYWELPDWQRGLVTLGEGIGMTFGVDLIQQGAINAAAANNTRTTDFPPALGDNMRIGVAASPQPVSGNQNMDQSNWDLYYGGVT